MTVQVLAVVGNPKTGSRTREVAEAVARLLADAACDVADIADVAIDTMEVAPLGPDLLGWGSPEAGAAVGRLLDADLLVVASPVYKATYTGLLKLLFDQVGAGALGGRVAVPLMVGAGPHHAMAVDSHLRPLLVEVGASCPTAGLYVLDSTLDTLDAQLDPWASQWCEIAVAAALRAGARRGGGLMGAVEVDQITLRSALGCFPTGVAAVCARNGAGEPVGLAANSFTSVSLEPPLVLFCIATTSSTWVQLQESPTFAISILAAHHEPVCRQLSMKGVDRFADLEWGDAPSGSPIIGGAVAWFDCVTAQRHLAGDHEIVVGEVTTFGTSDEGLQPLVFHRSKFGLS